MPNLHKFVSLILTALLISSCTGSPPASAVSGSGPDSSISSSLSEAQSAPSSSPETNGDPSSSGEPSPEPSSELASEPASEPEPLPDHNPNPFTGQNNLADSALGLRPVSVMVSNIQKALPQYGISQADMYYEVLAEGGITRIMALFADYRTVPRLGPVRSARQYYLDLAAPFNTIFVHYGGSNQADSTIKARGLDTVNGVLYSTKYFYQDQALAAQKGREHSFFTSGELIGKALAAGVSKSQGETIQAFRFAGEDYIPAQLPASTATVKYSSTTTARFVYDAQSGRYRKEQFGAAHMDAGNGQQLTVDNVFVLAVPTAVLTGVYKGLLSLDLSSGSGYYLSKGGAMSITWRKGAYNEPLRFYQGDEELAVNKGVSYLCLIPENMVPSFVLG